MINNLNDFVKYSLDDQYFNKFTSIAKKLGSVELEKFSNQYILTRQRTKDTYRIDSFCISVYENNHDYEKALKIAEELLDIRREPVNIRSFFRICRKIKNYDKANKLLEKYPEILKLQDFNILYELVYYFEAIDQINEVKNILTKIENNFSNRYPILKTVRNFYLKFNLMEDAKRVNESISKFKLPSKKQVPNYVQESYDEMVSQVLERDERLIAISDLARGISHEFGQPITNIRYTIQYYRYFFKNEITKEILFNEIFDKILTDTERMGKINERLSPITSSKSFVEQFDIIKRIQENVKAVNIRLKEFQIALNIEPIIPIFLTSDPVKFDQVINNLLLNSIDAIEEKKQSTANRIDIHIEEKKNVIRICFADTGKGVPDEYTEKIFAPFFSTKEPGKGEGLGLFIVWNILKMQGGTIVMDIQYNEGTRFIIELPKKETYTL